jgi:3-methyladenine DNA glycosylase/8-oxoguanine DNA glycosylase
MKLNKFTSVTITPTTPFDFDATFHKPSHFPSNDNEWKPGVRWQTWRWMNTPLGLKFESVGTRSKPKIKVGIYSSKKLDKDFIDSLIDEIKYKFNLEANLTEFNKRFERDKVLGPMIKKWKGMRPGHQGSLYEYIIIGIMLQNTMVKRSIYMLQVLFENCGTLLEYDRKKLWCFWNPGDLERISEQKLRELKLGYRAKSIKKIDEYFAEMKMDEMTLRKKDRETQMEDLLKLYGVGPATVWYLLFDVFHHWDFFNHVSPWEQKIYSKVFFDADPEKSVPVEKLLKHFEKFGDYKQLAVHYIWEDLWWKRKNENIPTEDMRKVSVNLLTKCFLRF